MSWIRSERLTAELPEDEEAIDRLTGFLAEVRDGGPFSFEHVAEQVRARSTQLLVVWLAELADQGVLRRIVRVESPSGGGIADYGELAEVPEELYDWRTDQDIKVLPEDLRMIFQVDVG